jgi:hypothetical protein
LPYLVPGAKSFVHLRSPASSVTIPFVPPDALLPPAEILADVWSRLAAAGERPDHPFRTAALATLGTDGVATARTVVVRVVRPDAAEITFHTDRRSDKFAELRAEPRCAMLFWDAGDKVQVRLRARAALHTHDAVADALWAMMPPPARAMYASSLVPGMPLPAPSLASPPVAGDGRAHFAAVRCVVESIDWLYLHPVAHRRARFDLRDGAAASGFVAP